MGKMVQARWTDRWNVWTQGRWVGRQIDGGCSWIDGWVMDRVDK